MNEINGFYDLHENPWPDEDYALDREVGGVRHRREPQGPTFGQRFREGLRRDVVAALISGPVVVPIWWGLWKVCDTFWGMA